MRNSYKASVLLLMALVVASCGILDLIPKPRTVEERIALTLTTITAARTATMQSLESGSITTEKAERIQLALDQARVLVDLSISTLNSGNSTEALKYIDMSLAVLNKVEELLRERSQSS